MQLQQKCLGQLEKIVKNNNTSKSTKIAQLKSFKACLLLELQRKNKGIEYPDIGYKDLKGALQNQLQRVKTQIHPACQDIYYHQKTTLALYSKAQKQQEKCHHLINFHNQNNKLRGVLQQMRNICEEGEKCYRSLDHYLKCKVISLGMKLRDKTQKMHEWKKENINHLNGANS